MRLSLNKHNCVFGLAGFSNSGKTTLSISLIKIFRKKGFSVGSIKHAHHDFEIDKPGKDSWRHREAGSQEVIVSSSKRIAHIIEHEKYNDVELYELLLLQKRKDIILVEGFKKNQLPKLEVRRESEKKELLSLKDKNIFAIATDDTENINLKDTQTIILDLNSPDEIVKFLIQHFNLKKNNNINKQKNELLFNDARNIIISKIKPIIKKETLPVRLCNSRVLTEDVVSKINLPMRDNAAVDGYGFNYDKYNSKTGTSFKFNKKIKAGLQKTFEVENNQAVRIFTGSILPKPINTIAMQENCIVKDDTVHIPPNLKKGVNCRPAGENLKINQLILKSGQILNSTDIGLASSLGLTSLSINKQLEIAVISTGNEIIKSGDKLENGLVYDSNGPMIFNLCLETGNKPFLHKIIKDNPKILKKRLSNLIKKFDMIIFSGGASEGDEDHIKSVIEEMSGIIHFWRLAIKPGRPMGFASINRVPIFCLPGNPVAAQVCFRLLVEAGIRKRVSANKIDLFKIQVISKFEQKCKIGRKEFLRGKLYYEDGITYAQINGEPGAGVLTSLSGANGLIEIDEDIEIIKKGDIINFIPFKEALI